MTQELKAGRKTDVLAHTVAMRADLAGFDWPAGGPGRSMYRQEGSIIEWQDIPYYSTDMIAAHKVRLKMGEIGFLCRVQIDPEALRVEFWHADGRYGTSLVTEPEEEPFATVEAALNALGKQPWENEEGHLCGFAGMVPVPRAIAKEWVESHRVPPDPDPKKQRANIERAVAATEALDKALSHLAGTLPLKGENPKANCPHCQIGLSEWPPKVIPSLVDEDAWAKIAADHLPYCIWVQTRGRF